MFQIISGTKGKGKTKFLLDEANTVVKEARGSVVYLDKNTKHMYELSNKVRLINVADYPVTSTEAFVGFICGIISQDHDLEVLFLDSFLKLACLEGKDITDVVKALNKITDDANVRIVASVSADKADFAEEIQALVKISL